MYLLDTSVCIDVIRGRSARAVRRLTACAVGEVGLSTIAVAELEFGAAKSKDVPLARARLDGFLQPLQVVAFDAVAARLYGDLRAYLERRGQPIGLMDLLLAAQAVALDAVVVTGNVGEFGRVPGLRLENWANPS